MRRAKQAAKLFLIVAVALGIFVFFKLTNVREKDLDYYYRAKGSRRGEVRQAKENKRSVTFSQKREGVIRSLWFDETHGLRREFHLKAATAVVDLIMTPSELKPQETFLRPHGWLQQKVGWELLDGSEVEQRGKEWVLLKTKRFLFDDEIQEKRPFQVVRYYDAMKAVWDIQKEKLIMYKVNFTDYKKMDHSGSFDVSEAQLLLQGFADEMSIHFKEAGKEEISSTGLKLKVLPEKMGK